MKTDELIRVLAADARYLASPISRTVVAAVALGSLLALLIFLTTVGVRSDFSDVATTSLHFLFKFVVTLSAVIPALILTTRLARPDFAAGRKLWWLAAPAVLLTAGIVAELTILPGSEVVPRMIGHNSLYCMVLIPLLSLAPFIAIVSALRAGAPYNPRVAGAVAGFLSAAIAATLYASRCTDDSPLFVAMWYPFGFAVMVALGMMVGPRLLRW